MKQQFRSKRSVVSPSFIRIAVVLVRFIFIGNGVSLRGVVGDLQHSTRRIQLLTRDMVLPHNLKANKLISLPIFSSRN